MKKGVSIPINTLVMLAVAIIVLLAAVAWFMGAFSPTAQESALKQQFDAACLQWTGSNCGGTAVPAGACSAYADMMDNSWSQAQCNTNLVIIAKACGCIEPYGTERPGP